MVLLQSCCFRTHGICAILCQPQTCPKISAGLWLSPRLGWVPGVATPELGPRPQAPAHPQFWVTAVCQPLGERTKETL